MFFFALFLHLARHIGEFPLPHGLLSLAGIAEGDDQVFVNASALEHFGDESR
jgi:hypothetical protein